MAGHDGHGIPELMVSAPGFFTVLFAMGRLPGWIAQWLENSRDGEQKLMRPRQVYTGEVANRVLPIGERA